MFSGVSFIAVALLLFHCVAQQIVNSSLNIQFAFNVASGPFDEVATSIAVGAGVLFVGGYFESPLATFQAQSISNLSSNAKSRDAFLCYINNVNQQGQNTSLIAMNVISGNGDETVTDLALDGNSADIFATVEFSSPMVNLMTQTGNIRNWNNDQANYMSRDALLLRFRGGLSDLNFAVKIGGLGDDAISSVSVSATKYGFIGGYSTSDPLTYNNQNVLSSPSLSDGYIVRFNASNGAYVSSATISSSGYDQVTAIKVDNLDSLIIVGNFGGTQLNVTASNNSVVNKMSNTVVQHPHSSSLFIVNITGITINWIVVGSGTNLGSIYGESVAVDANGQSYVSGSLRFNYYNMEQFSIKDTLLKNSQRNNRFLVKLSQNGDVLWHLTFGGQSSSLGMVHVAVDRDHVFLAGSTDSAMSEFSSLNQTLPNATATFKSMGLQDAFVCKLSASGDFLWSFVNGGDGSDRATMVSTDSTGNVYVVGSTSSSRVPFGPYEISSNLSVSSLSTDSFFVKISETTINSCASNPCGMNATCESGVHGFKCTCHDPYFGPMCTFVRACDSNPCLNGGRCFANETASTFFCSCTVKYTGLICNVEVPDNSATTEDNKKVYAFAAVFAVSTFTLLVIATYFIYQKCK